MLVSAEERVISSVYGIVSTGFPAIDDVIHLMAVQVASEQMIAIFGRPVVAEINHRADMRVASINVIGARLAGASFTVSGTLRRELIIRHPRTAGK